MATGRLGAPKVVDSSPGRARSGNADGFRFLKSLTNRTPKITLPGLATSIIAPAANISAATSIPTSTRSGRTWCRPTSRKCARSPRRAVPICRSTRPRWSSSAIRARQLLAERGDDWRDAADLYRRHQRGRCRRAERDDDRHSRLPQPGPELAGRCRLRPDRGAAVQRHEREHLFSRIRQCAGWDAS